MLGKLLKHEWNATARRYGLFYLVLALMTIGAVIMHGIPVDHPVYSVVEVSFLILYVLVLAAVLFCSVGMAVVRFYKNMVSDEGYLTFTLPAKVSQLVFSKFIVAFLWQIVTAVLVVLSLICVFVLGHIELKIVWDFAREVLEESGIAIPGLALILVTSLAYQITFYYLCIAIGQLFANQKLAGAIVSYCVLSFVVEIFNLILVFVGFAIMGYSELETYFASSAGMNAVYIFSAGLTAVLGVVAYFVTCFLLRRKLNLN